MSTESIPRGHLDEAPTHPRDWKSGVDDYLRHNNVVCDEAVPLNTGTSCYLWRLEGLKDATATANGHQEGQPVIMKCADSSPKDQAFPVAADRLRVEVRALQSKAVAEACRQEPSVQVPAVLRTTTNGFIMSHAGSTDLRTAYKTGQLTDAPSVGARLGKWLAHLHLAGIAAGPEGWRSNNDELDKFYLPGGIAEIVVRAAASSQEEAERILSALRAPVPVRTLTPWDFRPMNTVMRMHVDKDTAPDLTIVDWELAHYGEPSDDIRMWFAEVVLLEWKFEDRGMLSSFLSAYRQKAGPGLVDEASVCKVALTAGVYIMFIMGINPGVWDCAEEDAEVWKGRALEYIRAGTDGNVAWIMQTPLKPLLG